MPAISTSRRVGGAAAKLRHARNALVPLAVLVACDSAGVQHAYMALDATGARKRTEFFTDSAAIWCDLEYSSGRADLSIDVRIHSTQLWIASLQSMAPVDEVMAEGELPGQLGNGVSAGFQWVLADPNGSAASGGNPPYPVGDFVCDVMLDGEVAVSLPFTIVFPTCPVPPVASGAPCAGWVATGSVCPDAVGRSCTCKDTVWQC